VGNSHDRRKLRRLVNSLVREQMASNSGAAINGIHTSEDTTASLKNTAGNEPKWGPAPLRFRLDVTLFFVSIAMSILLVLFPPANPLATLLWIVLLFGVSIYPVFHFAQKVPKPYRKISQLVAVLLLAGAVTLLGRRAWPETPILVRLNFKDSPVLTPKRRTEITRTIDNFYRYLTEAVGLELPRELPPLGISPKGGPMLAGGNYEAPIYYSHIVIPEDGIDNPDEIRFAYSGYVFEKALVPAEGPLRPLDEEAAWVFFCYYPSSFSGNAICAPDAPAGKWRSALWEIRSRYGQAYADKLLCYTLKMWNTSVNRQDNFDVFFGNKMRAGETAIDNDADRFRAVSEVLARHGIRIE